MSAAEEIGYCRHNVPRIHPCNSCDRARRERERAQAQQQQRKATRR